MKRVKLSVVIDERQDRLDEHTTRTLYCAVEIPEETNIGSISKEIEDYLQQNDIKDLDKMHFTSMHPTQRLQCVELIGKMNITAKIYIYYDFREKGDVLKKVNLVKAVRATQYKHRNKELTFYVEKADEYEGVIKKEAMTSDHFLSLLADCYCYVFATRLNKTTNTSPVNVLNEKMYSLIRHQIRLHTYMFGNKKIEDSRSNRL
ncbi:hypothetical protein D3C86_1568730 [compost metagenome]